MPWAEASRHTVAGRAGIGVDPGAGLLHVLGSDCPVVVVGDLLRYLAAESASQCGPCMFGLPAIADDWSELADPRTAAAAHARLLRRLPVIVGRGACRHPDGAVRMAASALATFAAHLDAHRRGDCDAVGSRLLVGTR